MTSRRRQHPGRVLRLHDNSAEAEVKDDQPSLGGGMPHHHLGSCDCSVAGHSAGWE